MTSDCYVNFLSKLRYKSERKFVSRPFVNTSARKSFCTSCNEYLVHGYTTVTLPVTGNTEEMIREVNGF